MKSLLNIIIDWYQDGEKNLPPPTTMSRWFIWGIPMMLSHQGISSTHPARWPATWRLPATALQPVHLPIPIARRCHRPPRWLGPGVFTVQNDGQGNLADVAGTDVLKRWAWSTSDPIRSKSKYIKIVDVPVPYSRLLGGYSKCFSWRVWLRWSPVPPRNLQTLAIFFLPVRWLTILNRQRSR